MTDLVEKFSRRSDLHQSPMHRAVMADIGWETIPLSPGSNLFIRRLGPFAVAKLQRAKNIDLEHLKKLRRRYRILTLYVEPRLSPPAGSALKAGFSVEPFAHSVTSLLDLALSERALLSSFNQSIRRNILRAEKDPALTLRSVPLQDLTDRDLTAFFSLHRSWTKLRHVGGYPESFMRAVLRRHKRTGTLHFALVHGQAEALLLVLSHARVATYYVAFSTPLGYSHLCPTLLTWQALKLAKQQGCDIFDFGGIFDPRYPKLYKNWQGFTKFKEGFRPTVVQYPPTRLQLFW